MEFREISQQENVSDDFFEAPSRGSALNRSEVKTNVGYTPRNLSEALSANTEFAGNIILEGLPARLRRELNPSLKQVFLPKEQFIYQEEDRVNFIYFPVTAVVSEFKILEDGRMVEVAVIGKEGAIGLSSLLSDSHLSSNCTQVAQAGLAHRIDADTFGKLLNSDETLRHSLSPVMDTYIRQISQKAICNMYHSVRERLCTWLLMIQDRCGRKTLSLTHEQIARVLGVYRPSVTCIAQELRKGNLIDYSRGGISICDRTKIEESACTCYFELGAPVPNF